MNTDFKTASENVEWLIRNSINFRELLIANNHLGELMDSMSSDDILFKKQCEIITRLNIIIDARLYCMAPENKN